MGKATVLRVDTGKLVGSLVVGAGVDVIDFNARLSHLYVPSAKKAVLSIIGVGEQGQPSLLGTAATSTGAHCVTANDRDGAWVCDVRGGRLLAISDAYPASH